MWQKRTFPFSIEHGRKAIDLGYLLKSNFNKKKKNYELLAGEVGYFAGDFDYGTL